MGKKMAPFETHTRECVSTAHARAPAGGTHPQPVSSARGRRPATDAINRALCSCPENSDEKKKPTPLGYESTLENPGFLNTRTHTCTTQPP